MSAVALLSELLCAGGEKLPRSEYAHRPGFDVLSTIGIIEDAGIMPTILCDACDTSHDAQIIFDEDRGGYGFVCFGQGFVKVERDDIQAFRILLTKLVEHIATKLHCHSTHRKPLIDGLLWRIGIREYNEAAIVVYLVTGMMSVVDARDIAAAISSEIGSKKGLLLTPDVEASFGFSVHRCRLASLSQAIAIDPAFGLRVEVHTIASLAGVELIRSLGRPSEFEPMLSELIAQRQADGLAESGKRTEARSIADAWSVRYPEVRAPTESTIRRALESYRAGS